MSVQILSVGSSLLQLVLVQLAQCGTYSGVVLLLKLGELHALVKMLLDCTMVRASWHSCSRQPFCSKANANTFS